MKVGDLIKHNKDGVLGIVTFEWLSDKLSNKMVEVLWVDGYRSDIATHRIEKVDKK